MGSDRSVRTRLIARCCYGVSYGFGFVITVFTLAAMFWIAWCYFGLTVVQLSDSQRRAVVNYSYSVSKPTPSPTSSPNRLTTLATEETSLNSISKSPTTASVLRGSSRGESPIKVDKKETTNTTTLAKGDFASRDREVHISNARSQGTSASLSPPRGPPKPKDEILALPGEKAASILSGSSSEESEEDRIYARKVLPPGKENRPDESDAKSRPHRTSVETPPVSRVEISPTKVRDVDIVSGNSRRPQEPNVDRKIKEEDRVPTRDYIDREKAVPPIREDVSSSRRSNTEPGYRDPDFDREYPPRSSSSSDRDRTRYDDIDDDRGSRSRYDKIDRGRDTDDRYSKGDTRVYPDDRGLRPVDEDRYRDRSRDRYPERPGRRGDDDRYEDRYRDYDDRPKYRERDPDSRNRERVSEERPILRDDKYIDDDSYRSRPDDRKRDDDRYRSRDDDRYRSRDDERYRSRDDERYRSRDDDKYRTRDDDIYRDDRYRDDDRYRIRDDDSYKSKDDRLVSRDDDRYRTEVGDRRNSPPRYRDEEEISRTRADYDKYADLSSSRPRDEEVRESISRSSISIDSPRSGYETRNSGIVSDYDVTSRDRPRTYSRDEIIPSRISRPSYDDERDKVRDKDDNRRPYRYDDDERDKVRDKDDNRRPYRYDDEERDKVRDKDDNRRPYRYDDDERTISPTKTRDEVPFSRSTLIDSRPKDIIDERRYADGQRDRVRDDRYDRDDRVVNTRLQGSRISSPTSETSRLNNRDEYRTKLPNERTDDAKFTDRKEGAVLDRRSYISEEDDEYRRSNSRRDSVYDDRIRRPLGDTRKKYDDDDDERYTRRDFADDEEYQKSRKRLDDRPRSRDTYDDDYRRRDDRYRPRNDDRYISRDDRSPVVPDRKYDTYPDDVRPVRRKDPEISDMRKDDSIDRLDRVRPSISSRDDERSYSRDEYSGAKSSSRRRYDDDLSLSDSRDSSDDRRRSAVSTTIVNSREPPSVIIREKRYQITEKGSQSSRVSAPSGISNDRSYQDDETDSRSRDVPLRPLSAKDVIEAAVRQSDDSDQIPRKVYYPVFDPRVSNLTSPELIRPNERRGTIIMSRKRRSMRKLNS